jgi:glyoxylase-like metal-dependent hydrolase (beta-lactamase superfamily II)
MNEVSEVAPDVFLIDCFFADIPDQCGIYLIRGERNALIDSGPSPGVEHVIAGLEALDIDAADVHYILLTHAHLDHAGGASFLLDHFPPARVLVDEKSARYLESPERLLKSAGRALGDIAPFYGIMRPIPAKKIIPLRDGYRLDLGCGKSLTALHTPGHSAGHFAFLEPSSGSLFCGDSLGHHIEENGYIFPATPPPEFDLELSLASAGKLMQLDPALIFFTHFGTSHGAREAVGEFVRQLERLVRVAEELGGPRGDPRLLAEYMMGDLPRVKEGESRLLYGIMEVNAKGMLHYLNKLRSS